MSECNKLFAVHIVLVENYRDITFSLVWRDLSFEVRKKYNWYFRYRAALLQVANPKHEVQIKSFTYDESEGPERIMRERIKNRIIAKKRKITELENKLRAATESWTEIFPIINHPLYSRVLEKIKRLKLELEEIQSSNGN